MTETPNSTLISTKRQRIAQLASNFPGVPLNTLAHHLDLDWLLEAHRLTRKDGAVGVDGQTAQQYAEHLEDNLRSLLDRAKSGSYRAPPSRRVHLPKERGPATRPISIPTFEDKILQRAVVMVLEPIYEQEFLPCSFGFRPGRSAHQAVQTLWEQTMAMGGGWILDLDIETFFDTLDRTQLREMLEQRIRDGVLLRLIGKWLNAGALDDGEMVHSDAGTPQGGVISPLLANLYLHVVLDVWFETAVKPRLKGRAFLVRYADDAVLVFEQEHDARRVLAVLPKRFGKYGLRLHPDKTKLIEFRPPGPSGGGGGTFDFLSFTHHWGKSLRGNWVVKRSTCKSRFRRAVRRIWEWCRDHRHDPIAEQHKALSLKLRGHYAYYGITGNSGALGCFRTLVARTWQRWLSRRSQRAPLTWEEMTHLQKRHPLPPTRVVHSYVAS